MKTFVLSVVCFVLFVSAGITATNDLSVGEKTKVLTEMQKLHLDKTYCKNNKTENCYHENSNKFTYLHRVN